MTNTEFTKWPDCSAEAGRWLMRGIDLERHLRENGDITANASMDVVPPQCSRGENSTTFTLKTGAAGPPPPVR